MISVCTRLLIALGALGVAAAVVLGDGFFQAMGAPPKFGRVILLWGLVVVALVWTFMVAARHGKRRKDDDRFGGRNGKNDG